MNSFAKLKTEALRLAVLQVLQQAGDYELNQHIIRTALQDIGVSASQDKLQTELAWLAEQELVCNREVGTILLTKLTTRGQDAVTGRTLIPGLRRPSPDEV